MNYFAYGLVLSSTLPLPELPHANRGPAELRIGRRSRPIAERDWSWLQARPRRRKGTWVAVASRGGEYRVIFDGGAEFIVCPSGRSISAREGSSPSSHVLRHRLIDQVVPLVMSCLGRIVLHASAIAMPCGAVAFLGPAGAGKSTLASSFALAGTPLLSDDALFVEPADAGWCAIPAYPGVRVHDRNSNTKRRLTSDDGVGFVADKLPLRRVYVLKRSARAGDRVRIERLAPRDSIMALIEHAFVLDTEDRTRMAAHFARVSAAAASMDVRELIYPRTLSTLPRVHEAVLDDMEGHGRR